MRAAALPQLPQMAHWDQAGRVAWSLPAVTRHWADPPLPAMSERQLVAAHRHCNCHPASEERHTLADWDAIEARQRAFAADPVLVQAEGREITRLTRSEE